MKRITLPIGLALVALLLTAAAFAGSASFSVPSIKWNAPTRCTTITLGDGTPGPTYCKSPTGTGGYFVLPNCPPDTQLPSGALCQVTGGKGQVGRGSGTAYMVIP